MAKKKEKNNIFVKMLVVLILGVLAFFHFSTMTQANTLKFVQISDAHISDRSINTSYKMLTQSKNLLTDTINQINIIPNLDFVMLTGDGVDVPREALINEYCDMMNRLYIPWYMAFGNHDISLDGKITKDYYLSILRNKNKSFTFKQAYYSFTPKKGYKVIVLDPVIDYKLSANGNINDKQLNWLSNQIKNTPKDDIILIFLHHPIREPFSSIHHRITNAKEIDNILKIYNRPIAVFSGHYHVTKIMQDGKILHVSTPSLVTYPNSFRVVQVTNNNADVTFKFDFKETNLKEVQSRAKMLTFSNSSYYGEPQDRSATVVLKK